MTRFGYGIDFDGLLMIAQHKALERNIPITDVSVEI
jgi:hypothetical protein